MALPSFIRYHRLINLLSLMLVAAGLWALSQSRREAFPPVVRDLAIIEAAYPGATPEQVERLIIAPIEEALTRVTGLEEVNSTAVEGLATVVAEIDPDAGDVDARLTEIEQAIDQIDTLPADLPDRPSVREIDTRKSPIVDIALSGPMDEFALQTYARRLAQRLELLPDVARVAMRGWREPQIWVEVDPQAMRRYTVSLAEVAQRIRETHIDLPGGLATSDRPFLLRTTATFRKPADFAQLPIRATERGDQVRLGDVATVRWAVEEGSTLYRSMSSRAINLVVIKKERGDAITMVDAVRQILDTEVTTWDDHLHARVVNDLSFFIRRRLQVLRVNGIMGLALVTLTLFLFLSPRTALGAAIGIPIAGLAAVALLGLAGATINLITMFGMIMVIGMLVDEDLVIAENIHRHLEMHDDTATAVVRGAREIRTAMVATALTTVAAFSPLLFMGGMIGKFVRWIPLVVIVTLISSLIEALLILPTHLHFLMSLWQTRRRPAHSMAVWRWFERVRERYRRALVACLQARRTVLGVGTLLMAGAVGAVTAGWIPFHLFPSRGIEIFFIRAEAPVGTPLETTEQLFARLEAAVAALPAGEVDAYTTQIGLLQNDPNDPYTSRGTHVGQVAVYLTPPVYRTRTAQDIIAGLRDRVGAIPAFTRLRYEMLRHGPSGGKPVEITVRGPSLATLEAVADELAQRLRTLPGVQDVDDGRLAGKAELAITVDPARAATAGVDTRTIAQAIQQAFQGVTVSQVRASDDLHDVVVRFPATLQSVTHLDLVQIPTRGGQLVPLAAVASHTVTTSPQRIRRRDGQRVITVGAELDEARTSVGTVVQQCTPHIAALESRFPGVTIAFGGEAEESAESLAGLRTATCLAALLILGILLAALRSFGSAFVVLTTIPLGFAGVVFGFLLERQDFTFMALLGMVGMTGVIVDVAIILLDLLRQRQADGMPFAEALMEAAMLRFRPIVLVMITTVLGIIPTAYGIGGSDPFIQPMALAMNWGLGLGTILCLFWIPCLAAEMEHWRKRLKWGRFQI